MTFSGGRMALLTILLWADTSSLHAQEAINSLSCAERLKLPRFGPAFVAAPGSSIEVIGMVRLAKDASVIDISVQGGEKIHQQEVTRYLRDSVFRKACGGKALEYKFTFRVEGPPMDHRVIWMEFSAPNQFIFYTNPEMPIRN